MLSQPAISAVDYDDYDFEEQHMLLRRLECNKMEIEQRKIYIPASNALGKLDREIFNFILWPSAAVPVRPGTDPINKI